MLDAPTPGRDDFVSTQLEEHLRTFTPVATPPFAELERRRRSRDLGRRRGVAVAAATLGVAGVALAPNLDLGGRQTPPVRTTEVVADPATRSSPTSPTAASGKSVGTGHMMGAARERARRQEAVVAAAAGVRAIDDGLTERGLTGMLTSPDTSTVDVWWVGPPPAALRDLAARSGDVTVKLHRGFHTDAQIETAASRLLSTARAADTTALGYDAIGVTRELDGSGLVVTVTLTGAPSTEGAPAPVAIADAVKALPSLIPVTRVITGPQAVAMPG